MSPWRDLTRTSVPALTGKTDSDTANGIGKMQSVFKVTLVGRMEVGELQLGEDSMRAKAQLNAYRGAFIDLC